MIIEIGTSDFRTQAGKRDGLFIEPVKEHFNRLPICRKENVAISNEEGSIEIYYIPLSLIQKHELPNWIRGCNSIGKIHPTIVDYGYEQYVKVDIVKVVRIASLIKKYDIRKVDILKIDTEGHDTVILNDWLDTVDIFPTVVQFENNSLSNTEEVNKIVYRLQKIGYECEQVEFDMVCKLL
jgi:FkbM family methyltransferase